MNIYKILIVLYTITLLLGIILTFTNINSKYLLSLYIYSIISVWASLFLYYFSNLHNILKEIPFFIVFAIINYFLVFIKKDIEDAFILNFITSIILGYSVVKRNKIN